MLLREVENSTNKWKDTPCLWIETVNIVQMLTQPRTICFSAILTKIPMAFCTELEQIIPKLDSQKNQNSQSNLEENKAGGIMFSDCKIYYKDLIIKTIWYWHKNRHDVDWWKRIQSPDRDPCL